MNNKELTENELLLLIDIVKDQYEDKLDELRRFNKGEIDNDVEIAFLIKKKMLPDIQNFFLDEEDFTMKDIPDIYKYDDLVGEDIAGVRKKFRDLFKEKDKKQSDYRKRIVYTFK